jgi:aldehyde dehydrogenase (NAD+)
MLSFDPDKVSLPEGHYINGESRIGSGSKLLVKRPSDGLIAGELT